MMGFAAFFIYFLFMFLGVLFYAYYGGREFDNGNTIILEFAAGYGLPGMMGIIAAAVIAASMSSLDSSLNSMSTVTTVDFYERFYRKSESPEHYLKVSRALTVFWAAAIVLPALLYARSEGSILQTLSQVGSYFVGAKLSMYGLGFFSKHATERGVLIGVAVGFLVIWLVATQTRAFRDRGAGRARRRLVPPTRQGRPRFLFASGFLCPVRRVSLVVSGVVLRPAGNKGA